LEDYSAPATAIVIVDQAAVEVEDQAEVEVDVVLVTNLIIGF